MKPHEEQSLDLQVRGNLWIIGQIETIYQLKNEKQTKNVINCQSDVVIYYSINFIFLIKLFHKTRRKEWYRDEKSNFINRSK